MNRCIKSNKSGKRCLRLCSNPNTYCWQHGGGSYKNDFKNIDIEEFAEKADSITKKNLNEEWFKRQVMLYATDKYFSLINNIYPNAIFCEKELYNKDCLSKNLKKRYLNPTFIANLSYILLHSNDDNMKSVVYKVLQMVDAEKENKKLGENPFELPRKFKDDIKIQFWDLGISSPEWFDKVYNSNRRQNYGITDSDFDQYIQQIWPHLSQKLNKANNDEIVDIVSGISEFIRATARARTLALSSSKEEKCHWYLVTATYKGLPYGSVLLFYDKNYPERIRMEWIFRFPIFTVLDRSNPDHKLLQELPKLNTVLIPGILDFIDEKLPKVRSIFVDPIQVQSDYLQNHFLFTYDIDNSKFYPCDTVDSGSLSSKLRIDIK